jgi:hypothetical protein
MSAVLRARALLAAALLVAGCSFDPSGTLAEGSDAGPGTGIDAMRASSDRDPTEAGDGGPDGGAGGVDAAPAIDAMEPPPDAEPDEDDCGGFGQDCCDEGDACGGLLVCVGGTCI